MKKKWICFLLSAALSSSVIVNIPIAQAQEGTIAQSINNETTITCPVAGRLTIQKDGAKVNLLEKDVQIGEIISISHLKLNQEYKVTIVSDSIYIGTVIINSDSDVLFELYTMDSDNAMTRSTMSIEYETEPNNSLKTANKMNSNTIYGKIDKRSDKDFYRLTIPKNGDYAFALDGIPDGKDYDLYLYNSKGKAIASSAGNTNVEVIRVENLKAGEVYSLEVRPYGKTDFDKNKTYRLQYAQTSSFVNDHGSSFEQATKIVTDQEIKGKIDYPKDVDYFTFRAPKSGLYTIYTSGNTNTVGRLFNSSKEKIAENDDSDNWNFKIEYELIEGQSYYVTVAHQGIGTGDYVLMVSEQNKNSSNINTSLESAKELVLGKEEECIFYSVDKSLYYFFTPTVTGSYSFSSINGIDSKAYLIKSDKTSIVAENVSFGMENNFFIANTLLAGQTYYLKIDSDEIHNKTFSISIQQYNSPDDFNFKEQYYLLNSENALDINSLPIMNYSTGNGVLIGIADTGIDYTQEDLLGKIHMGLSYNFAHNIPEIFPQNESLYNTASAVYGHGTHIAGIIAANTSNKIGIAGIAPDASLIGYKVFGDSVSGFEWHDPALAFTQAIYKAKKDGVKIINCSFGGEGFMATEWEAMKNAPDILFVVAAGNSGHNLAINPEFPACYDLKNILVVGSVNNNGELSSFSNYGGPTAIAAPGEKIYSTLPKNKYNFKSGTSFAAPMVAAVGALLLEGNPNLTPEEIIAIITNTKNVTKMPLLVDKIQSAGIVNATKAYTNIGVSRNTLDNNRIDPNPFEFRSIKQVILDVNNNIDYYNKTGNIIIKVNAEADISLIISDAEEYLNVKLDYSNIDFLENTFCIQSVSPLQLDELVELLNSKNNVIYAEPSYLRNKN